MKTVNWVFAQWGSVREMAGDLGVHEWTAGKWRQRGRIPHDVWPDLIAALRRRGHNVTADDLLSMHVPGSPWRRKRVG